jgi:hypothetical protein
MEHQIRTTGILDLPPELLQQIVLYCDHSQILHLKDVCLKFHSVCSSSSVWRKVRLNKPTPLKVLESCLPLMKNATTELRVRGFLRKNTVRGKERGNLSRAFLEELATSCPGLKLLRLEDCYISWSNINVSHLPKTIEKLSLAGCRVSNNSNFCARIGDSSKFREMFPHLTEVDLSRSCLGYFASEHRSGFWPWSTGVKKVIMHGSNGVWGDRLEGFPETEQNCLVESLDLTDLSNVSLTNLNRMTRLDVHNSVTGRNMPELREICLHCTDPNLKDESTFNDDGLYNLFGGFFEEERAMPLLKLEILDLRGTAVTGEGMD